MGSGFPLAGTHSDYHVAGAIQLVALKSTQTAHGRDSRTSLGVWGLSSTHRSRGRFYKGRCRVVQRTPHRPEFGWCCVVHLSRLRGCRMFFRLRTMGRCRLGYHSKRVSMSHVCIIVWFLRYGNANKQATGIPAGGREKTKAERRWRPRRLFTGILVPEIQSGQRM